MFHKIGSILRHYIFYKSERENRRRKKILLILALVFVSINGSLYYIYLNSLTHFATTSLLSLNHHGTPDFYRLTENLTSVYSMDLYSVLLFLANIALVEFVAIWYFSKKWVWHKRTIAKKITGVVLVQLLLVIPTLIRILVPYQVIGSLIKRARAEVRAAHREVAQLPYSLADIITRIQTLSPPTVLSLGEFGSAALSNYLDIKDVDTFYRGTILESVIISDQLEPLSPKAIIFKNGHLVISPALEMDSLQKIVESLAYAALKDSDIFPNIGKKVAPRITFLATDEYNKVGSGKLLAQEKKIQNYIASLRKDIVTNNQYIESSTAYIAGLERDRSSYLSQVNPYLTSCSSNFSSQECEQLKSQVDASTKDFDTTIAQSKTYLDEAKKYVPLLRSSLANAENSLARFRDFPIIPELQAGLFEVPANIYIKYDMQGDAGLTPGNYFYTVLHELLHYYSHSASASLPTYLEEGITDYLALDVGQDIVPRSEKIGGYPEEIQIVAKIVEDLGKEKLGRLYFSKSEKVWTSEIDSICGKNCYKNLTKLGDQLTYTQVSEGAVKQNLVTQALNVLARE